MGIDYRKGAMIYEGKAKRLYEVEGSPQWVVQEFKDSLTAFNALKKGSFENKGRLNRDITALVFKFLEGRGVPTHRVAELGTNDMVTEKLTMLKVEVVVRNVLAGSTAKKFGIEEGTPLEKPLVEFYYKEDALADPFISDEQALMMKVVKTQPELDELKTLALKINLGLIEFFGAVGLRLVDFKLEFGRNSSGKTVLADEITPDSCRLWDKETGERMDKDRFRRDLGNVKESYEQVYERLKNHWEKKV
ncbi:MAG: phosphoribosylaminoimidazolesuccinocarboxamide synthase [Bdellovibrionota bacterium]